MATTTRPRRKPRPPLSDDDLSQVLALSSGADSVELKLTVPDADHRSAIAALGLDPLDAQIRLVSFFDTPDLALNRAGLIVRARRVQGREDDSVIKLRPVVPDELPDELRRSPGMVVELDAMPGGYVCSASLKARLETPPASRSASRGKRATSKLFTKAQRAFYAAHAPDGLELDDLSRARADLRPQAQHDAAGLPPQARRRDVALSRRLTDPRALDEVRTRRDVPGRGRGPGFPDRGTASTSRASSTRRRRPRFSSSRSVSAPVESCSLVMTAAAR